MEAASITHVSDALEPSGCHWVFLDCCAEVARSYSRHQPFRDPFCCRAPYQLPKPSEHGIQSNEACTEADTDCQYLPVGSKKQKRRKRAAQPQRNPAEVRAAERHTAIHSTLLTAWQACLARHSQAGESEEHLSKTAPWAEGAAELDLVTLASMKHTHFPKIRIEGMPGKLDLFDRVTHVDSATGDEVEATVGETSVILPSGSSFMISDVAKMQPLVQEARRLSGFDLVVIDPPWENASARRSQAYSTLPNWRLFGLPVRHLLAQKDTSIVAIWVTNREKLRKFVEEELLPHWGLRQVAVWYWLKMTSDGQLVTSLDSEHRRPYEPLVLARPVSASGTAEPCPVSTETPSNSEACPEPPDKFVMLAEPGSHSRKPRVGQLLKRYIPHKPKCAELFARELEKDWMCWGNEALKFQVSSLFHKTNLHSDT